MGPSHELLQFRHPFPSYRNRPPLVSRFSASEVWTCDWWSFTRLPSSGDLPPYGGRATRGGRGRPGRAMSHATLGDRDLAMKIQPLVFFQIWDMDLQRMAATKKRLRGCRRPTSCLGWLRHRRWLWQACAMSRETYFETPWLDYSVQISKIKCFFALCLI